MPQGSILSVTLFAIKINALATKIPAGVHKLLFVDDLQIAYSHHDMHHINGKLQETIVHINRCATANGFKFSTTKTVCMSFYRGQEPVVRPNLTIGKIKIPSVETTKFLGLWWDPKLSWHVHISQLKAKATRALNVMRTLSGPSWGADQEVLMRTYRMVIRSKIDYGCVVYGSAYETLLKSLDTVANEAMRIATGAFKSTPIESLQVLVQEPALLYRREELLLR